MWTHAPWSGRYLPAPLAPRDRLRAYATWCNAVEGNTTFYATPSRAVVETWAEQTPPDFRFVPKLPRTVTHVHGLTDAGEPLRAFFGALQPLGERLHTVWIQLPPSFSPRNLGTLAGFLRQLPSEYRYAVEVRHRAFFEDARAAQWLERVLAGADAEWITFDTTVLFENPPRTEAEQDAWFKKPRLPRRVRALTAHPVVRYLGRDDAAQTTAGWHPWAEAVARWLREGRSPTVFVHTPDNAAALALARNFHDEVRARVPEVEALAEPMPVEPPTLF
ncbi:MAG TPA: DUF72 domain-containing protein [Amycolatopsis sp.]|nr:DUF72 domain-containing protein [Amycolatopsis sp.]